VNDMALTRGFRETILARVQRAPKFHDALLKKGIEALLAGDVDAGKAIRAADQVVEDVGDVSGRAA
jgi:hypothetical protein